MPSKHNTSRQQLVPAHNHAILGSTSSRSDGHQIRRHGGLSPPPPPSKPRSSCHGSLTTTRTGTHLETGHASRLPILPSTPAKADSQPTMQALQHLVGFYQKASQQTAPGKYPRVGTPVYQVRPRAQLLGVPVTFIPLVMYLVNYCHVHGHTSQALAGRKAASKPKPPKTAMRGCHQSTNASSAKAARAWPITTIAFRCASCPSRRQSSTSSACTT